MSPVSAYDLFASFAVSLYPVVVWVTPILEFGGCDKKGGGNWVSYVAKTLPFLDAVLVCKNQSFLLRNLTQFPLYRSSRNTYLCRNRTNGFVLVTQGNNLCGHFGVGDFLATKFGSISTGASKT